LTDGLRKGLSKNQDKMERLKRYSGQPDPVRGHAQTFKACRSTLNHNYLNSPLPSILINMRSILFLSLICLAACGGAPSSQLLIDETGPDGTEEITIDTVVPALHSEEIIPINIPDTVITEVYESSEYEDIDWDDYEASMTKDFSFVIIISTKSYEAALERAKEASEKLGYELDLRGLHPNNEMGLSLPEEVCEVICGGDVVDYPQYLPRNDWGESKYVSVEYSNGFEGFTKGYYIVVVASGEKGDPIIQEALEESRAYYEDAYAKTCGVWMGCGC